MSYLARPVSGRAVRQRDGEAPGGEGGEGGEGVLWPRIDCQQDWGGLLSEICLTPELSHLAAERSKYPQLAARFLP